VTNDTTLDRSVRHEDLGGLPVRPMPPDDGCAHDAPSTAASNPASGNRAPRVQRVRGIRARFSRAGGRTYAYVDAVGRTYALGGYADDGLARHVADQTVTALAEVMPETPEEILEAFVCEVEESLSIDARRNLGAMRCDPIATAVHRIGVQPTHDQIARLYGVHRTRIAQIEADALQKLRPFAEAYR